MHQGKINQINSLVVKVWKKEEVVFEITHACSIRANRFLFVLQDFTTKRWKTCHRPMEIRILLLTEDQLLLVSGYPYVLLTLATTCTNAQKQGWLIHQSFPLLFQKNFIIRDRFILNFMFSQLKSSRVLQYRTAASRKCSSYCLRKWEQQRSIDSLLPSVL